MSVDFIIYNKNHFRIVINIQDGIMLLYLNFCKNEFKPYLVFTSNNYFIKVTGAV